MRALTVSQPWAYAILHGKDVENRDWRSFPAAHLGTVIALHAGRPRTRGDYDSDRAEIQRMSGGRILVPTLEELPVKAVVGTFRVRAARQHVDSPWRAQGTLLGLLLDDVRAFAEPVEVNGQLGLWEVPADVYNEMRAQAQAGRLRRVWSRDAAGAVVRVDAGVDL